MPGVRIGRLTWKTVTIKKAPSFLAVPSSALLPQASLMEVTKGRMSPPDLAATLGMAGASSASLQSKNSFLIWVSEPIPAPWQGGRSDASMQNKTLLTRFRNQRVMKARPRSKASVAFLPLTRVVDLQGVWDLEAGMGMASQGGV